MATDTTSSTESPSTSPTSRPSVRTAEPSKKFGSAALSQRASSVGLAEGVAGEGGEEEVVGELRETGGSGSEPEHAPNRSRKTTGNTNRGFIRSSGRPLRR